VQIRAMQDQGAPIRVIAPGRVYRMDMDQTHTPMFHQVEGLAIDRDISMANLKWCLEEFCRAFFEVPSVGTALPRQHFPFTEPSAEVDIRCSWERRRPAEDRRGRQVDGDPRAPAWCTPRCCRRRGRPDPVAGLRLRHGHRPDRDAEIRHPRPARLLRGDLRWLRHYGFAALDMPTA
jgi:phenylalanyl-tRNA synthetase alpha chain